MTLTQKEASVRKIVVSLMLVVAALGAAPGAVPAMTLVTPPAAPVVYAHRGGAGYTPENTLAAFRKTADLYGDRGVWLELDTQRTADGVLVVMHDQTVDRTTNCAGSVSTLTAAQITACDAAANYPGGWPEFVPVPTIEQVLAEGRVSGWRLMIEIKGVPGDTNFEPTGTVLADKLIALVNSTGFPTDRLLVQSFWPASIDRIELKAPEIGTVLLTGASLNAAAPGVGFSAISNTLFCTFRGYEVSSPDFRTTDFSAVSVAVAHVLGRQVVPWTIDDPATITLAASYSVDGIISNRPDVVFATLE